MPCEGTYSKGPNLLRLVHEVWGSLNGSAVTAKELSNKVSSVSALKSLQHVFGLQSILLSWSFCCFSLSLCCCLLWSCMDSECWCRFWQAHTRPDVYSWGLGSGVDTLSCWPGCTSVCPSISSSLCPPPFRLSLAVSTDRACCVSRLKHSWGASPWVELRLHDSCPWQSG